MCVYYFHLAQGCFVVFFLSSIPGCVLALINGILWHVTRWQQPERSYLSPVSTDIVCFLYLCIETMIVYIALAKYVFNWSDEEKKVVQNKPFILPDVSGKSDSYSCCCIAFFFNSRKTQHYFFYPMCYYFCNKAALSRVLIPRSLVVQPEHLPAHLYQLRNVSSLYSANSLKSMLTVITCKDTHNQQL